MRTTRIANERFPALQSLAAVRVYSERIHDGASYADIAREIGCKRDRLWKVIAKYREAHDATPMTATSRERAKGNRAGGERDGRGERRSERAASSDVAPIMRRNAELYLLTRSRRNCAGFANIPVDVIDGESWMPIGGYEQLYEVSNLGRVKGFALTEHRSSGYILRPALSTAGYPCVGLVRGGVSRTTPIHRLVMAAFVGPCPAGLEVNHIDHDKTNAALTNLEYVTHTENMRKYGEHAARKKGANVTGVQN